MTRKPFRYGCGNESCMCTHESPCERGWIEVPGDAGLAGVTPCRTCKPELARLVVQHKDDPDALQRALAARTKMTKMRVL